MGTLAAYSNAGFLLGRVASSRPAAPEWFYALDLTEHRAVVEMWVRVVGGIPVFAGAGRIADRDIVVRAVRREAVAS